MPRLPTYELKETPQTNLVTPDFSHKGGLGALGREVGKVLQVRGEQLTREYDTVKAVSAFNAFSDSSRGMVQGLLKLESGAAEGAQGAYKEWYGKNQNEFTGMLNSQPQHAMFKRMADQRREVDLNHLARHEATQYKVQKKEALDGNATNADLVIREAVTEALKTPGKDFTTADIVIEDFKNSLKAMFPGHDLKALNAKYTQLLRVAQLEEMMEVDPQTAREYIERTEIKDQLSFVENGILKDAYPALKDKLKVEIERDNIDRGYHAQIAKFPTDPGAAIRDLDPKRMKELDISVREAQSIKNIFKGEIQWARNEEENQRRENAEVIRNEINELMSNGFMKQALDKLDQSAATISASDYANIFSVIHTRSSLYTDTDLADRMSQQIQDGIITDESQVYLYQGKGLSRADTAIKVKELKEFQKNPSTLQYLNMAFGREGWYETEFADSPMMLGNKTYLRNDIQRQIDDKSIKLRGADILEEVKRQAGVMENVYRERYELLGVPLWKTGPEKTKAPFGEEIERQRSRDKARGEGKQPAGKNSQPVKSEFAPDSFAEIPESAKAEIESMLKKRGYAITDDNMLKVYQKNKDKLPKDNASGSW